MKEEDYFGSNSSGEESDAFSYNNRNQQYVSCTKENVSSGHSLKTPGNRDAPIHCFRSSSPRKDDQRATFSPRAKPHVHRTSNPIHKQGEPCYARTVRNMNLDETWKLPMPRRKTRQQLQREKEAAITIQSAWRGYQVRRDIDILNKAATRIQAAFRGYMTRKELSLGQYGCGRILGHKLKKKKRDKSKSRSFPELLNSFQQLGLAPGMQIGSQNFFLPSGKWRSYPQNMVENYSALHPKVALLEINSAQRPRREMLAYGVLVPQIQKQRYQDAATIIQAAWRGHQIRQKARPTMLQGEKSLRKSFCSNFTIKKIYRKHTKSGHTLEQHEVRGIIAKSSTISIRNVPRIRNINIYAIVKGMPASQRPSVSIRVSSPNAVVEGYQKDMSAGVHGLYTIKNHYYQRPSQILIHVNLQKEKDLKSYPYE